MCHIIKNNINSTVLVSFMDMNEELLLRMFVYLCAICTVVPRDAVPSTNEKVMEELPVLSDRIEKKEIQIQARNYIKFS